MMVRWAKIGASCDRWLLIVAGNLYSFYKG